MYYVAVQRSAKGKLCNKSSVLDGRDGCQDYRFGQCMRARKCTARAEQAKSGYNRPGIVGWCPVHNYRKSCDYSPRGRALCDAIENGYICHRYLRLKPRNKRFQQGG